MRKIILGMGMAVCLTGIFLTAAGCSKQGSGEASKTKEEQKQAGENSHAVKAAFDENLQEIIGEGLVYEVIDEDALEMKVATYHDVALEDIRIPEKVLYEGKEYRVIEIAESAFESNVLLRKITLPEGITTVGNSAFYSCQELVEVVFSNTVTSIGTSAFAECAKLSQITLPDSLESLGAEAFSNCISLESMVIPARTAVMDPGIFYGCEKLKECRFEQGVTLIGDEMFTNCDALRHVEIPDSVKSVGSEAFWSCSALTSITLPEHISQIGARTFYSTGLKELRLPADLSGITLVLLEGADELEKIIVPKSRKASYEKVFSNYNLEISTYE